MNTDSSTIAELVAMHKFSPKALWTPLFLALKGHGVDENVVPQDNKSAMLLEENGQRSSGKRTRAINICHFMTTDQMEKGNVKTMHCPMDDMAGNFMTKGPQGLKFRKFRKTIMGF